MVNRRLAQVATSDDEDEGPSRHEQKRGANTLENQHRRKRMKLQEEDEEEEEEEDEEKEEEEDASSSDEECELPKPLGEQVRVSGKGRGRRRHFESFEYDGNQYTLEDSVLLTPEHEDQKPYVAIIKDISQTTSGGIQLTGQWFYRPEEAEKKGGFSWQSRDSRELFYSFHTDEFPAESVLHKCVVHFVPIHKHPPNRKQHPGFIAQMVYDTKKKKLWNLSDKDYEDNEQQEIVALVQKTIQRLGELPDIEPDEAPANQEGLMKNKRILRKNSISPLDVSDIEPDEAPANQEGLMKNKKNVRKNSISPLDVSREEETYRKGDQPLKPETPGSCATNTSEMYHILVNFNALTGDTHRDKCLEKLLGSVHYMFDTDDSINKEVTGNANSDAINIRSNNKSLEFANECEDKVQKSSKSFVWPDVAVPAVVSLEKASHDSFSSDYQKYNQKLRQLIYNLKNNAFLARRLLNGELEPSRVLNMTPNELKEGLTADEITKDESDETRHMQMTDARCKICDARNVGLKDIIHTGRVDRYMLECNTCGHSWSAPRDAVSVLTIEASDPKRNVGTAPWATAKFEDVVKKLVSPRESDKSTNNIFKKPSQGYMPVLDSQKSFGKSRKDGNVRTSRRAN